MRWLALLTAVLLVWALSLYTETSASPVGTPLVADAIAPQPQQTAAPAARPSRPQPRAIAAPQLPVRAPQLAPPSPSGPAAANAVHALDREPAPAEAGIRVQQGVPLLRDVDADALARIQQRWNGEAADPVWTRNSLAAIEAVLASVGADASLVRSMDCRASLCRAVFDSRDRTSLMRMYSLMSYDRAQRVVVSTMSEPGEGELIAYFTRDDRPDPAWAE
jgi:hypothetical protein